MKKLFVLPMVAAALALSGCGKNLGKEIDKETFDAKAAEIAKKGLVAPKRVSAKGKIEAEGKKEDVNFDLAYEELDGNAVAKHVKELVFDYTISTIESMTSASTYKRTFHYDEKADTIGIAFNGSVKESAAGMTYEESGEGKFAWNNYGLATYMMLDQKMTMSAGGESETMKMFMEIDIVYTY